MTPTDQEVEAVARAIEHQHDYGKECIIWHEQIEYGGGYKYTAWAMRSMARAAIAALDQVRGIGRQG